MLITDGSAPFQEAFRHRLAAADQPDWLRAQRRAGMEGFTAMGFPSRRHEAWRFTDLDLLTSEPRPPSLTDAPSLPADSLEPWRLAGPSHRLVLVNGRFDPALSAIGGLPAGVWLAPLAETVQRRPDVAATAFGADVNALSALNAALFADGAVLVLAPGTVLETPVEIIHYSTTGDAQASAHPRLRVMLGEGAGATLVETAAGDGNGWTNAVIDVTLDADAELIHVHVQNEGTEAVHTCLLTAELARQARYRAFTLVTGACLSHRDMQVALAGPGAAFTLHGAYLLDGGQETTLAVRADHKAPDCRTEEVVKGVLQGAAHGVFLGTVAVRPGADGTDARQLNRNLLLSPSARVDTKPELEIFADDVKCSHGATVGSLDEAALFYLQARGIDPVTARSMLVAAFAADVIDAARLTDGVDALLRRHLDRWLGREGGLS
ncbi:Fe-S cluster assembly protein SufD [Niveispirillum irakense]|uniref:Fe-S cluster assembly protein SufD n=1 Tax=Niveispirillum irakense TaxID=34011 RepID=UPI00040CB248|nr:Fe-S cluster assembly protein SufD [Niveispirillum irakense]